MDPPSSRTTSSSKLPKLVSSKNLKESTPFVTITPPAENIGFQRRKSIPETHEAELKEILSGLNLKQQRPKLPHENSKNNLTLPSLCLKPLTQMPPIGATNPLTKSSSESSNSSSDPLDFGNRKPKFALPTVALATQIAISMKNTHDKNQNQLPSTLNELSSTSPPYTNNPSSPTMLSASGSIESASARSMSSSSASSSPRSARSVETPIMHSPTASRPRSFSLNTSLPPKTTESISENHDSDGNLHINQYQIMKNIGQGMYGKVKLAVDTETGHPYAVKILRKTRLKRMRRLRPGKISDAFQEVLVEIAIMKKLNHPNVVKLYEVLDDPQNDKLFMVLEYAEKGQAMELANGETTSRVIAEDVAWKYFRDLIAGLDYLHIQNIVHRDVKPENLLIASDGTLKIGDFGVSQVMDNSKQNITGSQGSPAFLAPEMSNRKSFRPKPLDVWAAGVTLYCFIFGHVPFTGKNYLELVAHIQKNPLEFDHPIDEDLQDLLTKMLDKDPDTRISIPQIKEHPWVTKHGEFLMEAQEHNQVWVTEDEIRSAIKPIDTFTGVVKLKSIARKLHRNLHSASSQMSTSPTSSGQSTPAVTRPTTAYSVGSSLSSSSSEEETTFSRVICSGNMWKITSPAPFQD